MNNLAPWQFVARNQSYEHFAMFAGVACGKTYTGSHFSLDNIERWPHLTGMIGANTHDQLSQATLREMLYWLDHYEYDYLVDERPPNQPKKFKTYKNIMSVRSKSKPELWTSVFTRIMSKADPLRGTEFSWYWLDETRDTPENTHDVIISRLREEDNVRRGLLTSTTNGEDWAYKRFVLGARPGNRLYGSMHVASKESVKWGIISQGFYDALTQTYSPLMAQQELDAMHVNVRGGRAYYTASQRNKKRIAPWGDVYPNRDRPLIVGADFNYNPAPCVWMVGQVGPNEPDNYGGLWSDHIHWFGEISAASTGSREMTHKLIGRYPDFFYRIFGDSYGKMGTTSNAGQHDYAQIGEELDLARCVFTIDVEQSNPHVKDRVENMNRLLMNALGQSHMTYDPINCPLFDADMRLVGWKATDNRTGRARLDNGGDKNLTHASDGGGYAVWKILPYGFRGAIGMTVASPMTVALGGAF